MTEQKTEKARPMSPAVEREHDAKRRFLADAGDHPVTVLHDDGLYRHLRSRGSFDWWEVVTWPGHLAISGGHGTWTFARTEDMFEFFRSSRGLTRINPHYWGEKLQGGLTCGNGLTEEYDSDEFQRQVAEHLDEWLTGTDWPDETVTALRDAITDEVTGDYCDWTHEEGARELLTDFRFDDGDGHTFRFHDTWEWDLCVPSFHFLWSCWAVIHAVAKYDASRSTPAPTKEEQS